MRTLRLDGVAEAAVLPEIPRNFGNDLFTRGIEYGKLLQPVNRRLNLPPASSPGSHRPVTQPRAHCMKGGTTSMIRKDEKTAVIEANRTHPTDTGSPEVQIAILTARIQERWSVSAARCWTTWPRRTWSVTAPSSPSWASGNKEKHIGVARDTVPPLLPIRQSAPFSS